MSKLWLLLLLLVTGYGHAQELQIASGTAEDLVEKAAGKEESTDEVSGSEVLQRLVRNPLNIFAATTDDWRNTGLLSEMQLSSLEEHRTRYGKILAIEELQQVPGFSESFIRGILPFIRCNITAISGKSPSDLLVEGEHYFLYRVYRILEEKQGYAYGPYSAYKGSPFGSLIRYRYVYRNTIAVSLNAEKDPGEEFFTGSNKNGFDFYSGSIALMNLHRIKMLVVGDYQVSYGQGLTFATASSSFSGDPVFSRMNYRGIAPYRSATESGFQRGLAISMQLSDRLTIDGFVSSVMLDGNVRSGEDSLYEENSVSAFQSSGYHRTWWEINDRKVLNERLAGMHLSYGTSAMGIGVTAVQLQFSRVFEKTKQPYNQFDFAGNRLFRYGVDGWWLFRNIVFFAEASSVMEGAIAAVGGLMISADRYLSFCLTARHYPRDYFALYSGAPGKRSVNANETGARAAATVNLSRVTQLSAAYDLFRYPWLVYDTNAPSSGREVSLKYTWMPIRKHEYYIRYRKYQRQISAASGTTPMDALAEFAISGIRLHAGYPLSGSFSAKTRAEFVAVKDGSDTEKGMMLYQDISWRPKQLPWQFSLRYAIFETDGYDSRIYAYENDVPGSYSVPAYYYKGRRYCMLIRYKASASLSVWFRYSVSKYSNRQSVGSGYEEIVGNQKSEVKLQVRYEFD